MFNVGDYLIPAIIHLNHTAYKIIEKNGLNGFIILKYIRQLEKHEGAMSYRDLYGRDPVPIAVDGSTYWRQALHEYGSHMRGKYLYPYNAEHQPRDPGDHMRLIRKFDRINRVYEMQKIVET